MDFYDGSIYQAYSPGLIIYSLNVMKLASDFQLETMITGFSDMNSGSPITGLSWAEINDVWYLALCQYDTPVYFYSIDGSTPTLEFEIDFTSVFSNLEQVNGLAYHPTRETLFVGYEAPEDVFHISELQFGPPSNIESASLGTIKAHYK